MAFGIEFLTLKLVGGGVGGGLVYWLYHKYKSGLPEWHNMNSLDDLMALAKQTDTKIDDFLVGKAKELEAKAKEADLVNTTKAKLEAELAQAKVLADKVKTAING